MSSLERKIQDPIPAIVNNSYSIHEKRVPNTAISRSVLIELAAMAFREVYRELATKEKCHPGYKPITAKEQNISRAKLMITICAQHHFNANPTSVYHSEQKQIDAELVVEMVGRLLKDDE